jgi:hypothetical protein
LLPEGQFVLTVAGRHLPFGDVGDGTLSFHLALLGELAAAAANDPRDEIRALQKLAQQPA